MARITVITKIRFLAAVAPVVMLVAAPILALSFLGFGRLPDWMNNNEIAALRYAQGLNEALYKMEWGRTQPDGAQIVLDQQRRFAEMLDSAAQTAYTAGQRRSIDTLAGAAKPILDAFRKADPRDQSVDAGMRKLHVMVTDLLNADESALDGLAERSRARAREFAVLTVIATVLVPWICFALLFRIAGDTRAALREIRGRIESLAGRPEALAEGVQRELREIDAALDRLGFPKPNPMLAEE